MAADAPASLGSADRPSGGGRRDRSARSPFWVVAAILLLMPLIASPFWLVQIFAYAMVLGMIALSLMFLAGYGGIVSLVQMTVAGFAGYLVAILGDSAIAQISLKWPWWTAVPIAILVATLFGTISGALSVRTEGIYTIMITLAIASAFYYLTLQNYTIFNGFSGFNGIAPPHFLGVDWRDTNAFYYLCLGVRHWPTASSSTSRARRSASPCRARATIRAGWRRSASTWPPIASPPTPSPP
jgi:branched-chain amino acid transport system permease protein